MGIINYKEYKNYEFRTWKTKYRGKIFIHAGLSVEKGYLEKFEKYQLKIRPGYIIGGSTITDCILVDEIFDKKLRDSNSCVFETDHVGLYAYHIENVIKYKNPIKMKGKLSLWDCEIPVNNQ